MRYVVAIAVAIVVAACTLGQSPSERAFLNGDPHAALARQDADAILQGMRRAQVFDVGAASDGDDGPMAR